MKQLDIRVPMGIMFSILGLILTVYGAISHGSAAYARSLDIDVNLWWGAVILIFGVALLVLAWLAEKRHARASSLEATASAPV